MTAKLFYTFDIYSIMMTTNRSDMCTFSSTYETPGAYILTFPTPQGGGGRNKKIRNREEKSKGKTGEIIMRKDRKKEKRREIVNSLQHIT